MKINILYFARLAETLGIRNESLELPVECKAVGDLINLLKTRGEPFHSAFDGETRVLVAINQQMSDTDAEINSEDEVAFFPPVTGG
jgi:molybdopterin synthase sulfur carrier subunit